MERVALSKLLINHTTAKDDPDRTTAAFVVANASAAGVSH